jgi:hypothetical protein
MDKGGNPFHGKVLGALSNPALVHRNRGARSSWLVILAKNASKVISVLDGSLALTE